MSEQYHTFEPGEPCLICSLEDALRLLELVPPMVMPGGTIARLLHGDVYDALVEALQLLVIPAAGEA